MSSDLPKDPRVREIFLRALREYSESCEPPGLTPGCPYSIETKDPGVMGCLEECMDLLGKYNAPRPREEVEHGAGIWDPTLAAATGAATAAAACQALRRPAGIP